MIGCLFLLLETINCVVVDITDSIRRHRIMRSIKETIGIRCSIGLNIRNIYLRKAVCILLTVILVLTDTAGLYYESYNVFEQLLLVLYVYFSMRIIISFLCTLISILIISKGD